MSDAEARAYFEERIVLRPRQLLWQRLRLNIVRETFVKDLLTAVGYS